VSAIYQKTNRDKQTNNTNTPSHVPGDDSSPVQIQDEIRGTGASKRTGGIFPTSSQGLCGTLGQAGSRSKGNLKIACLPQDGGGSGKNEEEEWQGGFHGPNFFEIPNDFVEDVTFLF